MMTQKQIRVWSWIHKWTSLISTFFILMLCITGLPLIFHHEIEHAMMPELEQPAENVSAPSLTSILAEAQSNRPTEQILYLYFDQEDPLLMVSSGESPMALPEDFWYQVFDLRTGNKLNIAQPNEGFMYILLRLHVDMFAGLPGMLFLGFMALLMLVAIISGVVLYAPFMRKLPFGSLRSDKGNRTYWLDLHNLLGIVTVIWLFVVGVTGAINTLATPIERMWQATELAEMVASQEIDQFASVDLIKRNAESVLSGMNIMTIAMPNTPFASPHHFGVYAVGSTPVTSRLLTPALMNAYSGEINVVRELPIYAKTLFISQPLHFGDYGGLPLKILWALLDILTIGVLVSGLYLWIKRRKSRDNGYATTASDDIEFRQNTL
jgi:uncharacterized iron-regulated membrane protein